MKQERDLGQLIASAGAGGSYTGEDALVVMVVVTNTSSTRRIDYTSWAADEAVLIGSGPKLTDEFGNAYKIIRDSPGMRPAFRTASAALGPKDGTADILLFEPPIREAKSLILELPQSAFGGKGRPVRFRLSTADLVRKKS